PGGATCASSAPPAKGFSASPRSERSSSSSARRLTPMPAVEANGLTVEYYTEGAGPPLVLLHGATSSGKEDFLAQLPAFRRAFRLYVPDARGHAGTIWDARRGFSTEMLVADLLAFADALGLQTFHLLGFSMGAMTALQFAVKYPERLRTLVVVGCDTQREPR